MWLERVRGSLTWQDMGAVGKGDGDMGSSFVKSLIHLWVSLPQIPLIAGVFAEEARSL